MIPASLRAHLGRPKSWLAVSVIVGGFTVGAFGLVLGPIWPLFWAGAAIIALGGVLAIAVGILTDVIMDNRHEGWSSE